MRVALVHDYLDQFGGQERVLLQLMKLFPEAPIYTLLYEPKTMGEYLDGRKVGTVFPVFDRFPGRGGCAFREVDFSQ